MIEIVESGRAIDEGDVARIEQALGCQVPASYRAFLLAHNGGRPKKDTIDIEGAPFKGTALHTFLGIDNPSHACDILWNLENLEGCIENKLLPFADDPYANVFVIDLNPDTYGWVYYFDASEIPPRPYLVAHDFNEFLNKLRVARPDELPDSD